MNESKVFEALEGAVVSAFEEDGSEKALKARDHLRDVAIEARTAFAEMGENQEVIQLLNNLVQVYITRQQFENLDAFQKWLSGVWREVEGQMEMIRALERAALSSEEFGKFVKLFEKEGLKEIQTSELTSGPDKMLLGFTLEGVK